MSTGQSLWVLHPNKNLRKWEFISTLIDCCPFTSHKLCAYGELILQKMFPTLPAPVGINSSLREKGSFLQANIFRNGTCTETAWQALEVVSSFDWVHFLHYMRKEFVLKHFYVVQMLRYSVTDFKVWTDWNLVWIFW